MLIQTASLDRDSVSDTMITAMFERGFSIINEGMGVVHVTGRATLIREYVKFYKIPVFFWGKERDIIVKRKEI